MNAQGAGLRALRVNAVEGAFAEQAMTSPKARTGTVGVQPAGGSLNAARLHEIYGVRDDREEDPLSAMDLVLSTRVSRCRPSEVAQLLDRGTAEGMEGEGP